MSTLRRLDDYFIGAGEGTASDRLYFYGTYFATGVIAAFTLYNLN